MCLTAVKRAGYIISVVPKKFLTEEICMLAAKNSNEAIFHIKNPTPELCLTMIKANDLGLQWVNNPSPEICSEAVKQNGNAIKYIGRPTPEMCLEAVRNNINAFRYINPEFQTQEIIEYVFKANKNYKDLYKFINRDQAPDYIKYYLEINNIKKRR